MRYFFGIFICLLVATSTYGQRDAESIRLSYIAHKKPLNVILEELSEKTGISIVYSNQKIPKRRKISVTAYNEYFTDILDVVLAKTSLEYDIVENQVILQKLSSRADENYTLSGYVLDKETGEPLISAVIYDDKMSRVASTNVSGFYSIELPFGYHDIIYSYLGYARDTVLMNFNKDKDLNMPLSNISKLNEVVVKDKRNAREYNSTSDFHQMSLDQMTSTASLGGEVDVIRQMQFLPGIASGADGFGGLNVRGGSEDQNLILYDNVPIYSVNHAFGLLSIFNSDMISNAKLYKGNIPAQFGGRLSSVLDIKTREGNRKKLSGSVTVSTLAAKAAIEGPIGDNGSSFIFTARRTFIDPWLALATNFQNQTLNREGSTGYSFYDLNLKTNFVFGKGNNLILNLYTGKDQFKNQFETAENVVSGLHEYSDVTWDWSNLLGSLNYRRVFGDKLFVDAVAYRTSYDLESYEFGKLFNEDEALARGFDGSFFKSSIVDLGLKTNIAYQANGSHLINMGVEAVQHAFTPGLASVSDLAQSIGSEEIVSREDLERQIVDPNLKSDEVSLYVSDKYSPTSTFEFEFGLRGNANRTTSETYLNLLPRAALKVQSRSVYFKMGIGRMAQNLHRLQSEGLGFPTAVWIPNTDIIKPETSWLGSASVGTDFGAYKIVTSLYYKRLNAVTTFKEGSLVPITQNVAWENLIPVGEGRAYGAEFTLDKISGKTTWRLNYSYGVSDRTFQDVNNGITFPFKYDRRHQVKGIFTHRLNRNVEFMANYVFFSGNRVTEPTEYFVDIDTDKIIVLYEAKNNVVLPSYKRFDFGFNFYSNTSYGDQRVTIGLYNLFNEKNYLYSDLVRDEENPQNFKLFRYTILPIFPSLSYSLSW